MNIPDDLQYTSHDEWVRADGEHLVVGITDFAQDQLGDIVHVELPEVGASFSAGDVVCEIESVKAVAEIYAPAPGTITAVNEALEDAPESVNSDPYGTWIYKLEFTAPAEGLLGPADYRSKVEQ